MKTWMWIAIIIVALGIFAGFTVPKIITTKSEVITLNDSISKIDSIARAEHELAVEYEKAATTAQASLVNCQSGSEEMKDSISAMATTIAEMDTTLLETKAALAAATAKIGKVKKPTKATADSTQLASKLPSGIKGRSKPR